MTIFFFLSFSEKRLKIKYKTVRTYCICLFLLADGEGDAQIWEFEESEEAGTKGSSSKDTSLHKKAWVILSGHVTNLLRMLQLMCEGHNADMQRLMRAQEEPQGGSAPRGG